MAWPVFWIVMVAAWFTHVIVSLKAYAIGLLIVGILCPPIGWVHGIGSWFGVF